jgi:serine/threonine-protein kinase
LAHAHQRGVIHRDIKSSNIVITTQGEVKVLDFGHAKLIRNDSLQGYFSSSSSLKPMGYLAGTINYQAPEVLLGERANVSSDIWSLGIVIYETATGNLPFRGDTVFELATAIMTSRPARPSKKIPGWTAHVIGRCLERDLTRRYCCARDVLLDLPRQRLSDAAQDMTGELGRMHTRGDRADAHEACHV